ncbi:MAG: phosphoglucosamine mutase [Thermoleophilia bacterium]|nr:phosphoglucosamine mutase [Thermoleophilia bacterium]
MARQLFGTDGIRGVANREITAELALAMGRAATLWVGPQSRNKKHPRVVIGRDSRRSGAMLEAALAAGVSSVGGEPVFLGIIPTPAVALMVELERADLGVVISASHNPFHDNGIKLFGPNSRKLSDEQEEEIEALLRIDVQTLVDGDNVGWFSRRDDARSLYAGEIVDRLEGVLDPRIKDLRIMIDCANGAAWPSVGVAFQRAGITADYVGTAADGTNINRGCGSTDLSLLSAAVLNGGYDIGVAYDGDADRMVAVDERGNEVDGDAIMGLLALDLKSRGALPGDRIVATTMSNLGLHRSLEAAGITVETCGVGDRYVVAKMRETGAVLGGEQSGHLIYTGVQTTGDGIAASLLFLSAIARLGVPVSEAAARIERLPQLLRNVAVQNKDSFDTNEAIAAAVARVEEELGDAGRVVLRKSGTEPLVRVMVEAPTIEACEQHVEELCAIVAHELQGSGGAVAAH